MVGISGGGGGGGGGYNYVQDTEPSAPEEGEEWYDTGANAAFVYDGAAWIEQTVVDHGQLSGVGGSDHHSRYTDSEAAAAAPVTHTPIFQGLSADNHRYTADTTNFSYAAVSYRCDPNGSAGVTIYRDGSQVASASSSSGTNTTITASWNPGNGEGSFTISINRPDNGGSQYWLGGFMRS